MDLLSVITSTIAASPGLITKILAFATGNMFILVALLAIFIFLAIKFLFLMKEAMLIAIIAALFPIVLIKVLNMPFDLTPNLVLMFSISGVVLLMLYHVIEKLWIGSKIFSIPVKILFKTMSNQYVMVVLLLGIIAAAFLFFSPKSSESTVPSSFLISNEKINYSCTTAEECIITEIECCWKAGFGTAMNNNSAKRISEENDIKCDRSNCPIITYVDAREGSNGIIKIPNPSPKAWCNSGKCDIDLEFMDCQKFCQSSSGISNEAAVNFTVEYTGIGLDEIKKKCGC